MNYQEFKQAVIGQAQAEGLETYELYYAQDTSIEVEALLQTIDKYATSDSAGVCFRCIYQGKMGYASTEIFEKEEAIKLVKDAMENASLMEEESKSYLYEGAGTYPKLQIEEESSMGASLLMDQALLSQKTLFEADERITQGSQSMTARGGGKVAIYNSCGIDLENAYQYDLLVTVPILMEEGNMYNAVEYAIGNARDFEPEKVATKAYEKCLRSMGAGPIPSGNYPVIFENRMMAALLSHFSSIFCGDQAQKGLSLLKGKVGSQVASPLVTILDDPMYEKGAIRRSFDDEGVPAQRKAVLEEGRLKTFLYDLKSAAVDGTSSTGNGAKANYASSVSVRPSQMYLQEGTSSFEDLLNQGGRGLVVTQISGMHAGADVISGDFSLNVQGYEFADGKRTRPVNQVTVAGNFYDLLKDIVGLGRDFEMGMPKAGSIFGAPSVLVKSMAVAGE